METGTKQVMAVGDKVRIILDTEKDRKEDGLYLPPGFKKEARARNGHNFRVGSVSPVLNSDFIGLESWLNSPKGPPKEIPLQAEDGVSVLLPGTTQSSLKAARRSTSSPPNPSSCR